MQCIKITLFFILTASWAFSQQDSLTVEYDDSKLEVQQITKDDLKKYKDDKNFNYSEVAQEDSFLNKIALWFRNMVKKIFEWLFGVGNATGILKFIFNILPYLILIFLVYLLIRFFLKVDSRKLLTGQQNAAKITFTEEEHILKNEDINVLIKNAIKQQNYRLAIRYYYLLALKKLSQNHIISWEQQKTNEDYISEIDAIKLKTDFTNITRIYDYVWYGEFDIDVLKFEALKLQFESLNNTLEN